MQIESISHKVNYYSLLLIAFLIPLKKELIPIAISIFILSGFFTKSKQVFSKKSLPLVALFCMYLIGLLYSHNTKEGLQNIETKLSLLAFPIGFYISGLNFKEILPKILKSFIEGCFAAVILSLTASCVHYYFTNDLSEFFYGNLSYFAHVSYFSMYLTFGVILLYYFSFIPNKNTYIRPIISLSLIVLFSLTIFLLSSKAGIISVLATHLFALFYWIFKHKQFARGGIAIISIIAIFFIGYYQSPTIHNRISELVSSLSANEEDAPTSSTQYRIEAWRNSIDLIAKSPIYGYGTGSTRDLLTQKYKENQIEVLVKKRLNTHNQFLEVTMNGGILGLILFIIILILPAIWGIQKGHFVFLFFLLLLSFNFLSESILETQAGVVFFAFFYTLIVSSYTQEEIKLSQ